MDHPTEQVAVAIIGGGICGVMAGARCVQGGISFVILERGHSFGGNWVVRANSYSHLQVKLSWRPDLTLSRPVGSTSAAENGSITYDNLVNANIMSC